MKLLIDTWNVLHQQGVLPPELAVGDLDGLVDLIRLSRWKDTPIDLVCDGRSGGRAAGGGGGGSGAGSPGVRVRWSGVSRTADDLIIETVRRSDAPRSLLVVSSDRAILREARKRRCRVLTSEAFLERLAADAPAGETVDRGPGRPTAPLSPGDVQRWADRLGVPLDDADVVEGLRPEDDAWGDPVAPPPAAGHAPSPRNEEPTDATPRPANPNKQPAAPIVPGDLLAEALAMVEADTAAKSPPGAPGDTPASGEPPETAAPVTPAVQSSDADPVREAPSSPPSRGASILPDDILAEALRMASAPAPADPIVPSIDDGDPPAAPPASPRRRAPLLPDDILGEAMRMVHDPGPIERSAPRPCEPPGPTEPPLRELPVDSGPFDDAILREAAEMLDLDDSGDAAPPSLPADPAVEAPPPVRGSDDANQD